MDHIAGSYHGYMPQNMYGMIPKFIHFARLVKCSNRLKTTYGSVFGRQHKLYSVFYNNFYNITSGCKVIIR